MIQEVQCTGVMNTFINSVVGGLGGAFGFILILLSVQRIMQFITDKKAKGKITASPIDHVEQ